ncbi:hypothetical protein AB4Z30_17630 [Paenibacillus sp. 2TAF8]|jgi:hypothetical protein|uniref:hypothetical protein n=1 Tax=Paenibacillus sp. 2TAF8 TaxID=3233020 RepID=UPI003F9B457F
MKVKCTSNKSDSLSTKAGYPINYQCESLIIGATFNVYSIGHWDNYMFYLLKVDHPDPDLNLDPVWFPYEWFEVIDQKIPNSWYFNFIGEPNSEQISTILGYKEIAFNFDHHVGLMEREKYHLDLFYKMKAEIDN